MKIWLRIRHPLAALAHDLLMTPLAWFGAQWLRFNFDAIPTPFLQAAQQLLPLVLFVHAVCYAGFGLYRGVWRFASMPDLVRIFKAVVTGTLICWALVALAAQIGLLPPVPVPRSSFVLTGLLLLLFLGAPRFVYRWVKDHGLYYRPGQRVLIVGAGDAGVLLLRELQRERDGEYEPVGFVDDKDNRQGRELHGVRVLGRTQDVAAIADRQAIDMIFVAMPSLGGERMARVLRLCEASGRPVRVVPRLDELLSGRAQIRELREVSLEDLLGREEVTLDWETIGHCVAGRTVLVSGGGGSIGSELCRQLARLGPARLLIVDAGEFNLYRIELELRRDWPEVSLQVFLLDVTDAVGVGQVFATHRPELVFHAAAYKHVPLLEDQPSTAIGNNVFGTMTLAQAADCHGADAFVLISTDKAVNPTNVMGASKRLAEMYCQNLAARSHTHFITVRFGNVLGSAGSVVPLFREQIARGGPVTVTHPEIERYFMTIPEAAQLILQAAAVGRGGEIFVLDMGAPIRIATLAEQMIQLSGKRPHQDIRIEFTGLRPGEKLYEELFHEREQLQPTVYPKLLLAQRRTLDWGAFNRALEALRADCRDRRDAEVLAAMHVLVPEYRACGSEGGQGAPVQATGT